MALFFYSSGTIFPFFMAFCKLVGVKEDDIPSEYAKRKVLLLGNRGNVTSFATTKERMRTGQGNSINTNIEELILLFSSPYDSALIF